MEVQCSASIVQTFVRLPITVVVFLGDCSLEFTFLDEYMYNEHRVTLSMESVTLHEKWDLVSMDIVDLCVKNEISMHG